MILRIANLGLGVLIFLGGYTMIAQSAGDWSRTIGYLFGSSLWAASFSLAWYGLGRAAGHRTVRIAKLVNMCVAALAVILVGWTLLFSDRSETSDDSVLGLFMIGVLLFLNVKALRKKEAELYAPQVDSPAEQEPGASSTGQAPPSSIQSEPLPDSSASSNYFIRHWRGELSLAASYWINGTILAGASSLILVLLIEGVAGSDNASLRLISLAMFSALLISVGVWLWSVVGIWRSAGQHVGRGGASGWAAAARVTVALGFFSMSVSLFNNILPQVAEFGLIAIGSDPIGEIDVKVSANGQSIILTGALREGSAVEVKKILDAAPAATSVVLNSNGGRLFEAAQIALAVRARNLDTYVEHHCESACTYIFLAGKNRVAAPDAKIGFHQPSFPGVDAETQDAATQEMLNVYRSAGLPDGFIRRVSITPPEDMWYPSREELISFNVITRISFGGEAAAMGLATRSKGELMLSLRESPLFQAIEKRFAGTIAEMVERAWIVKERGGSDAEIVNATRSVMRELLPKLLKSADDSTLDRFGKVFIDQLSAARIISGETCARWIEGKLDTANTLPKEIREREQEFLMTALTVPPRAARAPADPAKTYQAVQAAIAGLPQQYIPVIRDPQAHASEHELLCDAELAFFRNIMSLPTPERLLVLRQIFQSEG